MTTYLTKRGKVACLLFAVVVLAFSTTILMTVAYKITDGRYFQSTYGMHISRAYQYSDARMIKDTLEQSLIGIKNLGLEPDDSYRVLWFIDTKFSRVRTHILQIESVILATDQVIAWLDDMHGPSTTKEIGTDIYNVKLENIRGMVYDIKEREYRVQRAWILNIKRGWLWYFWIPWIGILFLVPGVMALTGDCTATLNCMYTEDKEQWKKDNKLGIW